MYSHSYVYDYSSLETLTTTLFLLAFCQTLLSAFRQLRLLLRWTPPFGQVIRLFK